MSNLDREQRDIVDRQERVMRLAERSTDGVICHNDKAALRERARRVACVANKVAQS